jgi:hypothetical protein
MQLSLRDVVYLLLSCGAGAWAGWCVERGGNALWAIPMGLPFALASYVHAVWHTSGAQRPDWRRIFILWAGMPLSLAAGALAMGAETGIMYALGLGETNLPFYSARLLIGEGTACLLWAVSLQVWLRGPRKTPRSLVQLFAALYLGVILAHGVSSVMRRIAHMHTYFSVMSIVVTMISALMVMLRGHAGVNEVTPSE